MVFTLTSTTSSHNVATLTSTFARHGIPEVLRKNTWSRVGKHGIQQTRTVIWLSTYHQSSKLSSN